MSEFIRFRPLRRNHEGLEDVELRRLHDVVTVELRQDDEALLAQMKPSARRSVGLARRRGVVAAPSDDLDAFHALYLHTMARLDADPFYLFPRDYLGLLERLGDRMLLISAGGAAGLYLLSAGAIYYHLGGANEEGRRASAMTLVHFEAMRGARERGLHVLHLGGGMRQDDSLHRFKESLGAGRPGYCQGRVVHDRAQYQRLCQAAGVAPDDDRYFPAYRTRTADETLPGSAAK